MSDVAELAGFSKQTVHRVLTGEPRIRAETRLRVMAAVEQLGYRPNLAARILKTGKGTARTLGVVCASSTHYSHLSMLSAIEKEALAADYQVTVAGARTPDRASFQAAIRRLLHHTVDGIVVIASTAGAQEAVGEVPKHMPVVAVGGASSPGVALVRVDQALGARLATEHLLSQGHSTVWHVAGPSDWVDARGRTAGWQAALRDAGAEVPEPLTGDWSPHSGYVAGRLLARIEGMTAVFAANDLMALGVMRAIRERDRRIPEDVSVVGFDDVPGSALFAPPLTTVRQDVAEVGLVGVRLLLDRVHGHAGVDGESVVTPQLVIRQSSVSR
jgi:DNA-binding LacI/PurR family transcriptional regulator